MYYLHRPCMHKMSLSLTKNKMCILIQNWRLYHWYLTKIETKMILLILLVSTFPSNLYHPQFIYLSCIVLILSNFSTILSWSWFSSKEYLFLKKKNVIFLYKISSSIFEDKAWRWWPFFFLSPNFPGSMDAIWQKGGLLKNNNKVKEGNNVALIECFVWFYCTLWNIG